MNNQDLLRTLYSRLHRVSGQLKKIEEMLDSNRPLEAVFLMLLAVEGALHSIIYKHFIKLIRPYVLQRLDLLLAENDLPLEVAARLESMRKESARCEVKKLATIFYELSLVLRENSR